MMKFVNLTRHAVTVYPPGTPELISPSEHRPVLDLPVGEAEARVEETITPDGGDGPVPMSTLSSGAVIGLPKQVNGTLLVASRLTAIALYVAGEDRPDVVFPVGQVRAIVGGIQRVIGCRSLARMPAVDPSRLTPGDLRVIQIALWNQGVSGSVEYALAARISHLLPDVA